MAQRVTIPLRPWMVVVLALGVAGFCGLLIAVRPAIGVAGVLGVFYAPLAFLNLPVAIAVWTPIPFIEHLPIVWIGPVFAQLILLFAWIGTLPAKRRAGFVALQGQRRAVVGLLAMLVWFALSLAWAPAPGSGVPWLVQYVVGAGVALIVMTSLEEERHVRWVLIGFVVGGALSILIGFASSGLDPAASATASVTQTEGRLQGGGGDPNYLAAGLIPAIVLGVAMLTHYRHPLGRLALWFGIVVLVAGLAATQSRGGIVGAIAAAFAALVILRNHRQHVLAGLAVVATLAGLWFAAFPGAWQRVTEYNGGGTGRDDLWRVALRVSGTHPVAGIGLGNFEAQAHRFVRRPGQLTYVRLIVDSPHVVHNTYLQILAETGIIGLLLWLAAVFAFLASIWRAAKALERARAPGLAMLARALLVGLIGMLVSMFFISDGYDKRLWCLLALGPVLMMLARRADPRAAAL